MLDYTVPALQFLIGGFDASEYLDSISLSVPMHEIGQDLLWSGRFTIRNNLRARTDGLTDAHFSEIDTPALWRPYQQQVKLLINTYASPIFRIENYRYNAQTRTGEGILTQLPTAIAGDRPGVKVETQVSGSIQTAIGNLLTAAFNGATVTPGYALAGDAGVLDVPLTSRNPWADALRLSSLSWNWLTVDQAEAISSVDGSGGALVFTRSPAQVELVPDLAAIFQAANQVIVTGARQVEDRPETQPAQQKPVPRPKFKKTREERPFSSVFSQVGDNSPILFEEKTIIYQYWDDEDFSDLPDSGSIATFLYDIQSQAQSGINVYGQPPPDLNTPLQTITMKRQPFGYLFSSVGTVIDLIVAEVIVESSLRKLILRPRGVLFPTEGTVTALAIEKRETLTSELVPIGAQLIPRSTDANGNTRQYEARPRLEPQQPIATRPLKTEVLKGVANIAPINWVPIIKKPLVVDFGFLPNQARADYLAERIAIREQRRRDQVLVDMPIPSEWLAGGWQPLGRCQIDGSTYLMDGCAISISDGEAKFGFAGALIGRSVAGVPTPLYQIELEVAPVVIFEVDVQIAPDAVEITIELVFEGLDTDDGSGGITTIIGTPGDDVLVGTAGADIIYGAFGSDTISGGSGDDQLFAGTPTDPTGNAVEMFGDGGDDTLTGGAHDIGSDLLTGFNLLSGTNATLRGVGEQDTLIGGGINSLNTFILGDATGCYYLGSSADYATIINFDPAVNVIQLYGASADYNQTFAGGVVSLYYIADGPPDLIALINATGLFDLNDPAAFSYLVNS